MIWMNDEFYEVCVHFYAVISLVFAVYAAMISLCAWKLSQRHATFYLFCSQNASVCFGLTVRFLINAETIVGFFLHPRLRFYLLCASIYTHSIHISIIAQHRFHSILLPRHYTRVWNKNKNLTLILMAWVFGVIVLPSITVFPTTSLNQGTLQTFFMLYDRTLRYWQRTLLITVLYITTFIAGICYLTSGTTFLYKKYKRETCAYSNVYKRLFFCGFFIFIPTLSHALLTQYHAMNYTHLTVLALRGSEIFSNLVIPVILYCTSRLVRRRFLGMIRLGNGHKKVISATGFVDLQSHRCVTNS